MAEFPALPLWTDAYLGDTTHLDHAEHGAYLLLLITAWRSKDCALPDDDRLLARFARCTPSQWKKLRPIIEPFFTVKNGKWTQGRLTDEYRHLSRKREIAAQNGRASALKRKGRHSAGRQQSDSDGNSGASTDGQQDSNLTTPIDETPIIPLGENSNEARRSVKHPLPDDWDPVPFGEGSQARAIVDGWSRLEFERQLEKFKAHHGAAGTKMIDWQRAWGTWVLNSAEFANRDRRGGARSGSSDQPRDFVDTVLAEHEGSK